MAIDELKRRADATDVAIVKLDERVTRHDEIIAVLCESLATKEDIASLRADLRERFDRDEFLHERLDHYGKRVGELETEKSENQAAGEHRFNRRMSWAVLVLFVGEVVLGWLGLRHG